jgi:hypothetical protein
MGIGSLRFERKALTPALSRERAREFGLCAS